MTNRNGHNALGNIRAIEKRDGEYYFILAGHADGEGVRVSERRYRAALEVGMKTGMCFETDSTIKFSRWVSYDEVQSEAIRQIVTLPIAAARVQKERT